jgi:hypothetical protein
MWSSDITIVLRTLRYATLRYGRKITDLGSLERTERKQSRLRSSSFTIINKDEKSLKFSLLHVVQTGSGDHPSSYPMGTGALSPRVKQPWREADDSPPTSAEVKKMWMYTFTPPYVFME